MCINFCILFGVFFSDKISEKIFIISSWFLKPIENYTTLYNVIYEYVCENNGTEQLTSICLFFSQTGRDNSYWLSPTIHLKLLNQ